MKYKLLKLDEVIKYTGMTRSSIYYNMEKTAFPYPIKTGARSVAWVGEELDSWIESRIALRDSGK